MTTQASPLALRLFLEGIESPCIGAQLSIQQGQPAAASIQIIPTDSALLLLPRTLVHLFYLDNDFIDPASTLRADRVNRNRDDRNRFQVADEQYRLLFSGEVIGYTYNKTSSSRSFVLQCLDLSSYWDTCYQWFADYSVGGNGLTDRAHNFVGAGQNLFNNVASGTRWVIGNILASKPENPDYARAEGLLAGYIHLLESIGGLRPKKGAGANYKSFRGVNDFFTIAELRYNLSGMIGAVESDKTSAKMFANKAFRNWLENGMASAGSLVSYRDVLALVGQYIFHDVYPNPAPFFVRGGTRISQRIPQSVADTPVGTQALSQIQRAQDDIKSVIRSTQTASLTQPGTIEASDGPVPLLEALDFMDIASDEIATGGSSDSSKVNNFLLLAASTVRSVVTDFRGMQRSGSEISVSVRDGEGISSKLQTAVDNLNRILQSGSARRTVQANVEVTTGDHLYTQLLLPETFFVVPPRCNVLFPDMYFSFSYSRNMLREVSRLSCQGGLGFIAGGANDSILGSFYYAPNIRDVRGKIVKQTIFASGSIVMPHEIHSGIIPKFEWVTDGHRWGVEAAKATGKNTENQKINYIQRLANFQFFVHRWASRSMSLQGRFNPHMVIGFPGVVIDHATPSIGAILSSTNKVDAGLALLPTAYIGKVATLQHTVGQDGGVTSVAYSQSRTHRGIDDEFLGVLAREGATTQTSSESVKPRDMVNSVAAGGFSSDLDLLLLSLYIKGTLVQDLQLTQGKITKVTVGTDKEEFSFDDLQQLNISLDDYLTLKDSQGPSVFLQNADDVFLPSLIQVDFQLTQQGKYIQQPGSLPFEDLVRPDYYSPDVWTNDKITEKVYLPLLGTRAITDDTQVGDPNQFAALIKTAIDNSGDVTSSVEVDTQGDNLVLKIDGRPAATIGLNLQTGTTTETAIDGLTLLYGILKKRNLDIQSFIDDYTKRPIANLVEVLGDSDLQFDASGDPIPRTDGTVPIEGFHSRAFGPYNTDVKQRVDTGQDSTSPQAGKDAFLALIPASKLQEFNNATTIIRKNESRRGTPIPTWLDPRGRAQARVCSYVDELTATRGIIAT